MKRQRKTTEKKLKSEIVFILQETSNTQKKLDNDREGEMEVFTDKKYKFQLHL